MWDEDKFLVTLLTHGSPLFPEAVCTHNKNTDPVVDTILYDRCTEFVHLVFDKTVMF